MRHCAFKKDVKRKYFSSGVKQFTHRCGLVWRSTSKQSSEELLSDRSREPVSSSLLELVEDYFPVILTRHAIIAHTSELHSKRCWSINWLLSYSSIASNIFSFWIKNLRLQDIGVARIFDCRGPPNHKPLAMTSSETSKVEFFMGAKISQNGRSEAAWPGVGM